MPKASAEQTPHSGKGLWVYALPCCRRKGPSSYGAYVPDLPGCVAAGESREEVLSLIREAIALHLEGLKEQGQPIPAPASTSDHVEVEAA